jgi:hypothetical protein
MKLFLFIIASLVLGMSKQAEARDLVKAYEKCTSWTTINGRPNTRQFRLEIYDNKSFVWKSAYFSGSDKCEGNAQYPATFDSDEGSVLEMTDFGEFGFIGTYKITNPENGKYLYFDLQFLREMTVLRNSDNYPLSWDGSNALLRTQFFDSKELVFVKD